MAIVISFNDFIPSARFDNLPWTQVRIQESLDYGQTDPWVTIDTQALNPLDQDPSRPMIRSFTTMNGTLETGTYLLTFLDAAGNQDPCDPVINGISSELLASLNDINAWLDGQVVQATGDNTALIQIAMSRVVKGYLAKVVDPVTMAGWIDPPHTPDIIREIASMLIAAQLYFDEMSRTSIIIEDMSYAQKLYDRAMLMLNDIIEGKLAIINGSGGTTPIPITPEDSLTTEDFFPIDDTDRAFTLSMKL
jgi:hypothetical protein